MVEEGYFILEKRRSVRRRMTWENAIVSRMWPSPFCSSHRLGSRRTPPHRTLDRIKRPFFFDTRDGQGFRSSYRRTADLPLNKGVGGLPRVVFMSGMSGLEVSEIIHMCRNTVTSTAIFAVMVPR